LNNVRPHLLVAGNLMTHNLCVVLLHELCMYKTQHLEVHLNLNHLVLDHASKQTIRAILDFDQNLRPVRTLFDTINLTRDHKLASPDLTHVIIVK